MKFQVNRFLDTNIKLKGALANVAALQNSNTKLEEAANRLTDQHTKLIEKTRSLEQQVMQLGQELTRTRRDLQSETSNLNTAKQETVLTKASLTEAQKTIAELRQKATELEQRHAQKINELIATNQVGRADLEKQHELEMETLRQEYVKAESTIDDIQTQLLRQTRDLRQREEMISTLENELSLTNKTLEQLQARYEASESSNQDLRSELARQAEEAKQANNELQATKNSLVQSTEDNEQLRTEVGRLTTQQKELLKTISSLEQRVDLLSHQLEETTTALNLETERVEDAQRATVDAQSSLAMAQQELETLTQEQSTLQQQLEQALSGLSEQTEDNERKRTELEAQHAERMAALSQQLAEAETGINDIIGRLGLQEQELSVRNDTIDALNNQLTSYQGDIRELQQKYEKSESKNSVLESKLQDQTTEAQEIHTILQQTKASLDKLAITHQQLEETANQLRTQNHEFREQINLFERARDHLCNVCLIHLEDRVKKIHRLLDIKSGSLDSQNLDKKTEEHRTKLALLREEWEVLKPHSDEQNKKFNDLLQQWAYVYNQLNSLQQHKAQSAPPLVQAPSQRPPANLAQPTSNPVQPNSQSQPLKEDETLPLSEKSYPNIFMEVAGGMRHTFTDELIRRGAVFTEGLPTHVSKGNQGTLSAAFDEPTPTSYKGQTLMGGDSIRSTAVFRMEDKTLNGTQTKQPVMGILKQDHTGKVTDMTTDTLTDPEKEHMALKQAKMLLSNCDTTGMKKPVIVIRGDHKDAEQAAKIWAALLLLKKDNHLFDHITIKAKITGHPEAIGPKVISRKHPTDPNTQAIENDAFINKHLKTKELLNEGRHEQLGLQQFTEVKDYKKREFDYLKRRLHELKKPPSDEDKVKETEEEMERLQAELNRLATEAETVRDNTKFGGR